MLLRIVSGAEILNSKLEICRSQSGEIWVSNNTSENHRLKMCELFGFGVGNFEEVTPGDIKFLIRL